MPNLSTLFFYFLLLGLLCFFCKQKQGHLVHRRIIVAFVILTCVSVFRWDIGNDYAGYARNVSDFIYELRKMSILKAYYYNEERFEVSYIFLSWLFSPFPRPYVWVIGSYSIIQIVLIYYTLKRNQGYFWGLFLLIVSELLFFLWDGIRQGVAITFVLFAIEYIKQGKPLKYVVAIIAGSLFHISAIVLLPMYVLRYIPVNRWLLAGIVVFFSFLMLTDVLVPMQQQVTSYFVLYEHYEGYAENFATTIVAESMMYKLRLLLYSFFWCGIILLLPKEEKVYQIMVCLGAVIFLFAMSSLTLTRIAWYFLVAEIVALPIAMRSPILNKRRKLVFCSIIGVMVLLFSIDIIRDSNVKGCVPYDSIFSDKFSSQKFRIRN